MNIITGYRGEPHIASQQERNTNIGIFGQTTRIIKDVGSELAATIISANDVDIADGMVVCQGCTAEVPHGTVEQLTIDNGAQGMMRTDLIVVRYTKNAGTGVENMELAVIKGAPVSSNPQRPSYTSGTIAEGDTLVEFPLYDVNINGISITSVERLVPITSVAALITALQDTTNDLQDTVSNTKLMAVNAPLGTLTFNNAGATGGTISVAQYIPAGYTMIGAIPASSGYFGAYFYTCAGASPTSVYVQLMRISGTQATTSPVVKLLCTKNL